MLLSLVPLSYIVVPNRELVNTPFSFNINNPKKSSTGIAINMEVNIPRDCSVSPSTNIFRALLTHSYMSFMEYVEHVKAVTNNTTWADQVELSESQGPALFYTFLKIENIESANQANANESISIPYSMISDNTCIPQDVELQSNTVNMYKPQGLKASTILYSINQLVDPQL